MNGARQSAHATRVKSVVSTQRNVATYATNARKYVTNTIHAADATAKPQGEKPSLRPLRQLRSLRCVRRLRRAAWKPRLTD